MDTEWDILPLLVEYVDKFGDKVLFLKESAWKMPVHTQKIFYNPEEDTIWIKLASEDDPNGMISDYLSSHAKTIKFATSPCSGYPDDFGESPWVHIKSAFSPSAKAITDLIGLTPGPVNKFIGGPKPLTATLLGGLAGAGVGYMGGSLAESLAGDYLQKKRLRKTLAMLGAGIGATPGMLWSYHNVSKQGPKGFLSSYPYSESLTESAKLVNPDSQSSEEFKSAEDESAGGLFGSEADPINIDAFNNVIWSRNDPFTPSSLRAATTGLVNSAGWSRGSSLVTPGDISRIAVGAGSGFVNATIGARALGMLAGLSPDAQKALQTSGVWFGSLKAVIPSLLGF
jgi:hypothetical protein